MDGKKDEGLQPKWFHGNALPAQQDFSEMLQASNNDDIGSNNDGEGNYDVESSEERGIEGEQPSDANGEESDIDSHSPESEDDESEYEKMIRDFKIGI